MWRVRTNMRARAKFDLSTDVLSQSVGVGEILKFDFIIEQKITLTDTLTVNQIQNDQKMVNKTC
jgi:hypothetical protein